MSQLGGGRGVNNESGGEGSRAFGEIKDRGEVWVG